MTLDEVVDCRNEKVIRQLYERLGRLALCRLTKMIPRTHAEEVLQDVFIDLWREERVFENLRVAYAWVYRCCTNKAIDRIRHHKKSEVLVENGLAICGIKTVEFKVEAEKIWRSLIQILSEDELSMLIYRQIEGMTQDEVAEVMQISRRSVNRIQAQLEGKLVFFRSQSHVG